MSASFLNNYQGNIQLNQVTDSDTIIKTGTLSNKVKSRVGDQKNITDIQNENRQADSLTVCTRNSIADVTFYDPASFVRTVNLIGPDNNTLIKIAELTNVYSVEREEHLRSRLKEGETNSPGNTDWIILVLLFSAFLISIVRPFTKNFQSILNYIPFRGIKDAEYGESGGLFHWQTTIQNFISFAIIALFIFQAATNYTDLPEINGLWIWLILLVIINVAFTLRYVICAAAGVLSNNKEAFRDYITGICQFYHNTSIVYFVLVVMISYTRLVPVNILLTIGFIWVGLMYILRILRLLIIFINRNISIFYLILYLCALEILPVAIAIRYFSASIL